MSTALSFVPDPHVRGSTPAPLITLIALHTVAAAIVVPTLAGRLAATQRSQGSGGD
jgi:hypothetical protein